LFFLTIMYLLPQDHLHTAHSVLLVWESRAHPSQIQLRVEESRALHLWKFLQLFLCENINYVISISIFVSNYKPIKY
jgi:hypothetical protein